MFNLEENKKYNRNDIINTMEQYKSFFTFEKYNKIKRISEKIPIQQGIFGKDMQINSTNDGPITIILDTKE